MASSTRRPWPRRCARAGSPAPASTSSPPSRRTESPLFEHESVVVTPHLGASTDEAQEKAGVAVAKSVRLALGGDLVPDAVNVSGGVVAEEVRPGIALVEKLGRIFTALAGSVPVQLDVDVQGEITAARRRRSGSSPPSRACSPTSTEDPVTYVNAPLLAEQRGCEVRLLTDPTMQDFRNVTTLRGTLADGATISVAGTLTGPRLIEKIVGVNGFDIEVPLTEHLAFFTYVDRPGVIGTVGRLLGDAGVNIAGMQVARNEKGGQALVALTVDTGIPADVLAAIVTEVGADVSVVDLALSRGTAEPPPRGMPVGPRGGDSTGIPVSGARVCRGAAQPRGGPSCSTRLNRTLSRQAPSR